MKTAQPHLESQKTSATTDLEAQAATMDGVADCEEPLQPSCSEMKVFSVSALLEPSQSLPID